MNDFISSFGRRSIRKTFGSLHAANEAQHKRLRRTNAQDIRLKAKHQRHPMKGVAYSASLNNSQIPSSICINLNYYIIVRRQNSKQLRSFTSHTKKNHTT